MTAGRLLPEDDHMAFKPLFTDEEWSGVLEAPLLAGFAITSADPGGLIGAMQESAAMARTVASRSGDPDGEPETLMAEVVAAYGTSEGRTAARDGVAELVKGRTPAEAADAAVARVGEIAATVAAKAPGEAEGFRAWLRETAQAVAEAASEGGFMGIGGEKISEAERKTLADLDAALGGAGA
jgi:hypothetical protein